jgi:peptidoglycan/xylan/chitin deacetylase (PgdA/CDA1 family)
MSVSDPRLSCAITFDFDAMSVWIGSMRSQNPSMISRGEFGAVATPRILDLLRRRRMRATWCVPGHTALAYPDLVRRIRDEGHELVHHGWVHENPASFDEAGERRVLERGLDALEEVAGVRPRGYRSPAWDLSPRSVDLLLEYGFEYDSSCMGSDFFPYYLRTGDRWSLDEPYVFGETTRLVELPVTWGLDDFPPFEFILGSNAGLSAPSAMEEIWRGDFDYAYANCAGGLYSLTLHPQVIGRGHRMLLLERLIDHFEHHDGVVFETLGDNARRWRERNPVESWKKANPSFVGPR